MAKSYQLVTWTDKGQVRMIPSQLDAYIHEEVQHLNCICDRVRYGTCHEVGDLLNVSTAYEKLALNLLDLGRREEAFLLLAEAAHCCTASPNNWRETEWGDVLEKPLRGRFFAMFCACKDLVRKYPNLQYAWNDSGLQQACDHLTDADRCFEIDWNGDSGDFWEAQAYTRALNFGKNEVYRRRRA
jgi:hypothetical protein